FANFHRRRKTKVNSRRRGNKQTRSKEAPESRTACFRLRAEASSSRHGAGTATALKRLAQSPTRLPPALSSKRRARATRSRARPHFFSHQTSAPKKSRGYLP